MTQNQPAQICPKGHVSSEADYCSECGARIGGIRIGGVRAAPVTAAPEPLAGETCPDCGTVREQREIAFCEVCGFNFQTGARGEIPLVPGRDGGSQLPVIPVIPEAPTGLPASSAEELPLMPVPGPAIEAAADVGRAGQPGLDWRVLVEVDATLKSAESPEPPGSFVPFTVLLAKEISLIGRVDEVRGIFPEIDLTCDEAVSRRHALLRLDPEHGQLLLRDIGAVNGTRLNGTEVATMQDHALQHGDEITLGHWSRLRVQHA